MTNTMRYGKIVSLLSVSVMFLASNGYACSSCYGAPDSPLTVAMDTAIVTLAGITLGVMGSFAGLFVWMRSNAKKFEQSQAKAKESSDDLG